MIDYTQRKEQADEKITQLKSDLNTQTVRAEKLDLEYNTLKIHDDKLKEQYATLQVSYDETVEKLHRMNKARHDLETKLTDEIERNRSLQDIVRLKEESILKR